MNTKLVDAAVVTEPSVGDDVRMGVFGVSLRMSKPAGVATGVGVGWEHRYSLPKFSLWWINILP